MRERARECACVCNERVRLRVCSGVCLCPFARARCVRACMRASVSACAGSCDSIGLQFRACVRRGAVRALQSHGGGLRYLKLGPRRALRPRARGCVRCDRPVVARVRPQVSPGRAARPTRRGLCDICTRPWSMPPAPSTSSAATAAPYLTTSTTSGRAPTEVRRRTRSRGSVGGYSRGHLGGTTGVLRGYSGVV